MYQAWLFPNMKLCTHRKTPADGHLYFCYLLFTKGTKEEQRDKVVCIYSLNEFMALRVKMLPHKSHRLTKPLQCQARKNLPLNSWSEKSKWLPKQHRLLMLPLAATQNLKVRLLLKRSQTLDKGLEDSFRLEVSWGPLPLRLTLIASEGAMQAAKGKEQSTVLPSCKAHGPQKWPAQQDILKTAIVALISWE